MSIDTKALLDGVRERLHRLAKRNDLPTGLREWLLLCASETGTAADRLAALENERNVSMGIGDGSGQRFVYGTYEAIKAAQAVVLRKEALEAELAESLQKIADLRAISNVNGDWTLKVKALEAENQRLREALDVIANLETDYPHDVAMKAIAAGGGQ